MRILFYFSILHPLYSEVAKELQRRNSQLEFSGIANGAEQLRELRVSGFPSQELHCFTQYLQREFPAFQPNLDRLARWEVEHNVPLSLIISVDRYYCTLRREETLKLAGLAIHWLESLFDRICPGAIIAEGIDCFLSYLLYAMAKKRGIPYLITFASPTPRRFSIYGNPDNRWDRMNAVYSRLKATTLTREQRCRAEVLLSDYRKNRLVPTYMANNCFRVFNGVRDLRVLWKVAKRNFADPIHRLDLSYEGSVTHVAAKKLRRVARALACRRYFTQPCGAERFVFFPLQMEPECSTRVFAPYHADQLYVIEALSKSLPVDHVLYVKEHPVMIGRRPLSYYKRIESYSNVRLIDARVHSHPLIQNSSAVVVITSTVGWEAMIYEKPVLVLGDVWYGAHDEVIKLHSVKELPAALEAFVHHPPQPNHELLLKFVTALLEGTYVGEIDHPDYSPSILSAENVAAVADAIRQHLEWLGQGSGIAQEIEAQSAV